jgi:hypothetical protein
LVTKSADGANYEVIGATSFGSGCARPNFPGVYADVRCKSVCFVLICNPLKSLNIGHF